MRKRSLAVILAVLALGAATELRARKTVPDLLHFKPGDSWSLEDTLKTRIPDPQTGQPLTPATKGVFRYHIEKRLRDGSALVSVKVVSLHGGMSIIRLRPLPVDHPERPEQYILMTSEGRVYGPYGDPERKKRLSAASDAEAYLNSAPQSPWVWYKLPESPLTVGDSATRKFGDESWTISRLDDEQVGGASCAVYSAKWDKDRPSVTETTWFDEASGAVVKREISEKRAKNVSSTLTQVRL